MSKIIELTNAEGRRIGLPQMSAIIILTLGTSNPVPNETEAKTMIRYTTGTGARIAKVRDPFKHVLNLFPRAVGGAGWTHSQDEGGNDLAFPEGSIVHYEEKEDGVFDVTLNCETGPLDVTLSATYEDIQSMLGEVPTAPPKRKRSPPAQKSR